MRVMPVRFTFELNSQTLQTLPRIVNIDEVSTKAQNRKQKKLRQWDQETIFVVKEQL